jgi:hypothetical protein
MAIFQRILTDLDGPRPCRTPLGAIGPTGNKILKFDACSSLESSYSVGYRTVAGGVVRYAAVIAEK